MKRYVAIIDHNGQELPDSRRSLDECLCDYEVQAIIDNLHLLAEPGHSIRVIEETSGSLL